MTTETHAEKIMRLAERYGAIREYQYSEEGWGALSEAVEALQAERDDFLEALRGLVAWADMRREDPAEDLRKAREAIARATVDQPL